MPWPKQIVFCQAKILGKIIRESRDYTKEDEVIFLGIFSLLYTYFHDADQKR
jgi:hypothetical protein